MKLSLAAAGVAILGLGLLGVAGPFYRLGFPLGSAFSIVRYGAYVALGGAALSLAAIAWSRRKQRTGAAVVAGVGVALGVVTAAVGYGWLRQTQSAPPLRDVTTDLENPPAFVTLAEDGTGRDHLPARSREVDQLQRQHYPDVSPLTLPQPAQIVFERARLVAENQGWTIVGSDPAAGRLEATDTTWWFGFTDGIVVRLTPWGTGTRVDVRSVSLRGDASDAGTNARRIRRFLKALQAP